MKMSNHILSSWPRWAASVAAVMSVALIACSSAATTAPSATQAPASSSAAPTTAMAAPTQVPAVVVPSKDTVTIVINEEPSDPNIFTSATLYPNLIGHNITQPMSFLGPDFVDTATGGFDSYEMLEPNKWRLHLASGIKFHNGEAWNAEAAKFSIDFLGDPESGTQTFSNVRGAHAEVVDDLTVDFICDDVACPFLPRFSQFHVYQAPEWYQSLSDDARDEAGEIIGWGPFKFKNWNRGESYTIERYDDYVAPADDRFIAIAPTMSEAKYVWRSEALVRSAMVQTGEADVAFNLGANELEGLETGDNSKWIRANNGEVITFNVDQIWDPFLKQLKFRQALAHGFDCQGIADAIYGPESRCRSGPNGIVGTLGVNEANSPPIYNFDQVKATELLEETGYLATGATLEERHEIFFWTRDGRTPNDVEIGESVTSFWNEIGINVKLRVVEPSIWREKHLTGPGRIIEAGGSIADVATSDPPEPSNASPGLVFFAPGGELFDFGRQLNFYASCASNRSKNCDPEREVRNNAVLASGGDERKVLMEAAYEDFTQNLLHIPAMDVIGVWGVNKDLDFSDMPGGRRILVNTMRWTQ